jgi:hypothetical protein
MSFGVFNVGGEWKRNSSKLNKAELCKKLLLKNCDEAKQSLG